MRKWGLRISTALVSSLLCNVWPAALPVPSAVAAEPTPDFRLIPGYADTPALAAWFSPPTEAAPEAAEAADSEPEDRAPHAGHAIAARAQDDDAAATADLRVFGAVAAKVGLEVSVGADGTTRALPRTAALTAGEARPVNVRMTTSALDGKMRASARFATTGKSLDVAGAAAEAMLPASVDAAYDLFRAHGRVFGRRLEVAGGVRQELTLAPDSAGQLRFGSASSRNEVHVGGSFAGVGFELRHLWSNAGYGEIARELAGPTHAVATDLRLPLRTIHLAGMGPAPSLRYSGTMAHGRQSDGRLAAAATSNTLGLELQSDRWSVAWSSSVRDTELDTAAAGNRTKTRREDIATMRWSASSSVRIDLVARRAATAERAIDYTLNEARLDVSWSADPATRVWTSLGASTWNDTGSGRTEQRASMTTHVQLPLRLWPHRRDAPIGALTFSQGIELGGSHDGSQGSIDDVRAWHVRVGIELPLP